jgi:hypothetical protein
MLAELKKISELENNGTTRDWSISLRVSINL